MRLLKTIVPALVLTFVVGIGPAALAHSVKDLEAMLGDREKYFQPVDKEAPTFALRATDDTTVRLADLRGKVVVLHFIYAGCPDVCPLHAEKIAEVQGMVNPTPMKDLVQFVTITTDPVNDTADVLRDYGPAHGLDPVNWSFLTIESGQPEDATRRLAEAYGHKFDKTKDGYQAHGVVTHVIDKEGRWRGNFHGLKFRSINLVTFINALTNDSAPHHHDEQSWWDRLKGLF